MAYQTGSASSPNDLLGQLAAWLVSRGWTQDASVADGTGWRVHAHKGGSYVHLKTTMTGRPWAYGNLAPSYPCLWVYMSTAFVGTGSNWNANTTGAPAIISSAGVEGNGIVLNNGAQTSYHFFDDGSDHIVVIVERTPGVYQDLGFGLSVTKHGGNWTGGAYFFGQINDYYNAGGDSDNAHCPFQYGNSDGGASGYIRADVDSFSGNWLCCTPNTSQGYGYTGKPCYPNIQASLATMPNISNLQGRGVSSLTTQAILFPIRIFAPRDAGGVSLLATIPSVFYSNAYGNGFGLASEFTIGPDTYKVFPNFVVKKVA